MGNRKLDHYGVDFAGYNPKEYNKNDEFYMVYFISPNSGKQIVMKAYEDRAEAQTHLNEFKKLYGKLVMAGIEEGFVAKNATMAVQNWGRRRSNAVYVKKALAALEKRRAWLK